MQQSGQQLMDQSINCAFSLVFSSPPPPPLDLVTSAEDKADEIRH